MTDLNMLLSCFRSKMSANGSTGWLFWFGAFNVMWLTWHWMHRRLAGNASLQYSFLWATMSTIFALHVLKHQIPPCNSSLSSSTDAHLREPPPTDTEVFSLFWLALPKSHQLSHWIFPTSLACAHGSFELRLEWGPQYLKFRLIL